MGEMEEGGFTFLSCRVVKTILSIANKQLSSSRKVTCAHNEAFSFSYHNRERCDSDLVDEKMRRSLENTYTECFALKYVGDMSVMK